MAALQKISTSKVHEKLTHLIAPGTTVVIALSGGPDSVFLLHQLVAIRESLGLSLIAAHLDHEWRTSSKDDVAFCKKLCTDFAIPLVVEQASNLSCTIKPNGSQEEVGRKLRRFFLEHIRQTHNAHSIALAHHQDDNLETFFINLIRGTTIAGLGGIKEQDGFFVRPLLNTRKQDILTFLHEHHLEYQIDPTNASDSYLRNRIRAGVLPALSACDSRAQGNLVRALNNLNETEQFLTALTDRTLKQVTLPTESSGRALQLPLFFGLDSYLRYRVLTRWLYVETSGVTRSSEAFLDEVMRFLASPRGGTHAIGQQVSVHKLKNVATIVLSS